MSEGPAAARTTSAGQKLTNAAKFLWVAVRPARDAVAPPAPSGALFIEITLDGPDINDYTVFHER